MFHSAKAMKAMKRAFGKIRPFEFEQAPLFEVPLSIQHQHGGYKQHYGRLGIEGFYFETKDIPLVGQTIRVKVVLVGLGMEVETSGIVTHILPARGHVGVVAKFEDIEFETERFIARWLDLMTQAIGVQAAG